MSTAMSDGVASTSPHRARGESSPGTRCRSSSCYPCAVHRMFILVADGGLLPHGPMLAALLVLALVGAAAKLPTSRQLDAVAGLVGLVRSPRASSWRCTGRPSSSPPRWEEVVGEPITLTAGTLLAIWPLVLLGGQWEETRRLGYLVRRLQGHAAPPLWWWWSPPDWSVPGTPCWCRRGDPLVRLRVRHLRAPDHPDVAHNGTGGSVLLLMICHLFSNLTRLRGPPADRRG